MTHPETPTPRTGSSHGTVPAGLTIYAFEYPGAWRNLPETVVCLTGTCERQPTECMLSDDIEATRFAKLYGATTAENAITGAIVYKKAP